MSERDENAIERQQQHELPDKPPIEVPDDDQVETDPGEEDVDEADFLSEEQARASATVDDEENDDPDLAPA